MKYGINLCPEPACFRTLSHVLPVEPLVCPSDNATFYLTLTPSAAITSARKMLTNPKFQGGN
jgi:hypothetical protein